MPDFCSAFGCSNERNPDTKRRRITFHRFPKDERKRQLWASALRRRHFQPSDSSVVCSRHFKPEDFDRTGQTTRLRDGAVPSLFAFTARPQVSGRTSRGTEPPAVPRRLTEHLEEPPPDHLYALDPVTLKSRLTEAQQKVEELQRDLRNARDRERRQRRTVEVLLGELHKQERADRGTSAEP